MLSNSIALQIEGDEGYTTTRAVCTATAIVDDYVQNDQIRPFEHKVKMFPDGSN